MYNTLVYIYIINNILIILLILSQPSKQQDALSLLSTDKSNTLFETQKPRGIGYLLQYVTATLGVIWVVLGIILMIMGNK
ncbi:preprotein translocase subunit SecG [Lactococcus sp. S64]|uniref:preprotein translocase subunit SecG n=1 Tax=Lactococcus sp. S64 TaxID=2767459 RepID=UPI0019078083|nr:preprotein translocase subunit SecG [Lactococcus sp. S64]MBK0084605.1 preprotein translocase subunit SecG [Lactococcus sp. S64]